MSGKRGLSIPDRMAQHYTVDEAGCWIWHASVDSRGYGKFKVDHKCLAAHRVSYTVLVGPIPSHLQIDHLCMRPACVNPEHMEPVTPQENIRRRQEARTHCPSGHLLDEANVYPSASRSGSKRCRTCRNSRSRRYKERQREMRAAA